MKLYFLAGAPFDVMNHNFIKRDVKLTRVVGKICTALYDMENKHFRAPAGTRFVIDGIGHQGFELELEEQCKCCGLYGRISRVGWTSVVIDGDPPMPPSKAALETARLTGGEGAAEEMLEQWECDGHKYHR